MSVYFVRPHIWLSFIGGRLSPDLITFSQYSLYPLVSYTFTLCFYVFPPKCRFNAPGLQLFTSTVYPMSTFVFTHLFFHLNSPFFLLCTLLLGLSSHLHLNVMLDNLALPLAFLFPILSTPAIRALQRCPSSRPLLLTCFPPVVFLFFSLVFSG